MTSKEKAKELIDKFWYVEPEESCDGMEYHMAQQCALIAVDEILENNKILFEDVLSDQYWQEVKNEIEKL